MSAALVGRIIAQRYRVEELVGGGAMGDVYRAQHVGLGTDVAIKIMRSSVADQSNFKERFYREAKAASRLEHPNSVRVLDFGQEDDGLVYLVMEFLRGRDLREVMLAEGPLSDGRIVEILSQTLAAMATAHSRGIVHRDLKPENIMIVPDEDDDQRDQVKVCDFGIAKMIDARAYKSADDVKTALTSGNALLGTPEYMSPEQARGEPLDARSDLYSVGVILYRMLARKLPFDAENAIGIAVKHITEQPIPPSRIVGDVNPRLEEICLRSLRKDPAERPASAKEMRAELRAALGSNPVATPPPSLAAFPRELSPIETAPTLDGEGSRASLRSITEPDVPVLPVHSHRRLLAIAVGLGALALAGAAFSWTESQKGPHAVGLVPRAPEPSSSIHAPPLARTATGDLRADPSAASATPPSAGAPSAGAGHAGAAAGAVTAAGTRAGPSTPVRPAATAPGASTHPNAPGSREPGQGATPSAPAAAPTQAPSPPPSAPAAPESTPYRPANAIVTREPLISERIQRDELERRLAGVGPQLNDCYRDALYMVGSPVGGRADIHMSIDPRGRVVSVVNAPQLPPFQRCAGRVLSSIALPADAVDPGGGTAEQGLKLVP